MTLGDPGIWRATPLSLACHLTRYEPEGVRYPWVRHADFISQRIAMAVDGIAPRYIALSEPPQHMKSTLVSKWANVWFLENWPHLRCILGGYSSDFAEVWGRRTRDAIDLYSGELSVRLNPMTNAAGEWETTAGGGLVATGVGGSITGRSGEGLIVIDDPYKDRAAANSAQVRENVWQWFTEVMLTRRAKNTVFVVLHTRWHPDDLIGRIQKKMQEGDPDFPVWDFINLPAIAEADDPLGREPGEALWPESKPIEFLRQQRAMMGSWSFNALYQGNPTDIEGNYFKRAWLESPATQVDPQYVPPRHLMRLVRIWDLAATSEGTTGGGTADGKKRKRADPDWSVGLLAGWYQGLMYVLDVERFRLSPAKTEQRVLATARRDGPLVKIRMQQDPGQAGVAQVHHYARNVLRAYDFRWKPAAGSGDKVVRSGPVNAAFERGDVKIVRGPFVADYVDEMTMFPLGAHDDQVDVTSYAYDELANAVQEDWNQENLAKAFSYGAAGQQGGQPDPDADPMEYLRWRQQQAASGRPAGDESDN